MPVTKALVMRIFGSNATARVAQRVRRRAAPRPAASPSTKSDAPKSTQPAASLRTIGGIDALIALQGQDDPAERRRRAVKRGRIALDALDELKIEVLGGSLGPSTLQRLKSATADLRDSSGDDRLDSVLAEIELRLEVEIAKMGPAAVARFRARSGLAIFPHIRLPLFRACPAPGGATISSPREQGGSFE